MAYASSHRRPQRSHAAHRPQAAIVIVPDAWCLPRHYENLAAACRALGSEVVVIHNPSAWGPASCTDPSAAPAPGLYDDAANARRTIEGLVRDGKTVLIVAHGYGAVVALESVRGLSREELMGLSRGGVVRMLFIADIVPWEGESVWEAVGGSLGGGPPEGFAGVFMYHGRETLAACMYSDAPFDEGLRLAASTNGMQSAAAFGERLTHAGYRAIPITYMLTDGDGWVSPEAQERFVQVVEAEAGRAVDVVRYPVDHCPTLTRLEAVVDCVKRAVGGGGVPGLHLGLGGRIGGRGLIV